MAGSVGPISVPGLSQRQYYSDALQIAMVTVDRRDQKEVCLLVCSGQEISRDRLTVVRVHLPLLTEEWGERGILTVRPRGRLSRIS